MSSIVVIGAGPGIGAAVARRFAREGYSVGLIRRNAEKLLPLAEDLKAHGSQVVVQAADAASESSLSSALNKLSEVLGGIDVLVYNPAVADPGRPEELDMHRLVEEFRVNVGGALVAATHCAPRMSTHGGGTILLTGGGFALQPKVGMTSLSLGKAALRNLTHSLAEEGREHGVHVATVTVCGYVEEGDDTFDPDVIAEHYWQLHQQAPDDWEVEVQVR